MAVVSPSLLLIANVGQWAPSYGLLMMPTIGVVHCALGGGMLLLSILGVGRCAPGGGVLLLLNVVVR